MSPGRMLAATFDPEFNRLTDLIGIPLAVTCLALLVAIDLRRAAGRRVGRLHLLGTIVVGLAAGAVIVVRFARVAG